jgi:AraC-like DNA-binding protein
VLSSVAVAAGPGFTVTAVTCANDHRRWSAAEPRTGYGLVLVRRGRFRRLARGVAVDADPAVGYLMAPDEEERFAHPAGGDVCTWVGVAPDLWHAMADDARAGPAVYVDARLDLTHRRLLAAAAAGEVGYGVAEELLGALAQALRRTPEGGAARDRAMVAAAREAIAADHPAAAGLLPLAMLLGVSPYRLSRAFPRAAGVSLTRYRNRIRVGRALDRLAAGERNLAVLAADLGFADQAHLCRTMRAHLGRTPSEVRRLLEPAG